MLSGLRLRLTRLYLGVGLAFLLLVGAGSYGLLRGYYQTSTDLALQHRLVEELRALGATPPPELVAADRAWYASRGRTAPLPTPTARWAETQGEEGGGGPEEDDPSEDDDAAGIERYDDDDSKDSDDQRGDDGSDGAPAGGSAAETAGGEPPHDEASEEEYDSELAIIFTRHLAADGRALAAPGTNTGRLAPSSPAGTDAVTRARTTGSDWRTVSAPDGTGIRLVTFRVEPSTSAGTVYLQLGRPLDDQERVLRRLLLVLLGLGSISAVLLGAGGWWLAGRSLEPAERAWRQQQAFVANASHELRTPVTLIRASAEVLQRSLPPSGDHRLLIDDILSECDHTSRLVSDLLLLSRLDSGQLDLRREPVPLDDLFADLARQFGRMAASHGVDLTVARAAGAGGAPIVVQADPTRLRQVLLALLDNALRHTTSGASIRLSATADAGRTADGTPGRTRGRATDRACIVVADTGAGIAPEDLPHVFERFYRAGQSGGVGADGGAGLGLAVARGLVEAQGGHITIESERGHGTRVTICLGG